MKFLRLITEIFFDLSLHKRSIWNPILGFGCCHEMSAMVHLTQISENWKKYFFQTKKLLAVCLASEVNLSTKCRIIKYLQLHRLTFLQIDRTERKSKLCGAQLIAVRGLNWTFTSAAFKVFWLPSILHFFGRDGDASEVFNFVIWHSARSYCNEAFGPSATFYVVCLNTYGPFHKLKN